MQYADIEKRLMESLWVKWQDGKMPKLEYYIANINPECLIQYSESLPMNRIQPYLITSMSPTLVEAEHFFAPHHIS